MPTVYMQGIGQMTPAQQTVIRKAQGSNGGSRSMKRRTKKAKSTSTGKRKAKRAASGGKKQNKFVKGSAAAKAYMAKIRKMRKKK